MVEYWNDGEAIVVIWEGRRIAVLAVDPTALPEIVFLNTPTFHYSNEVIDKPTARGTGNKLTGNFSMRALEGTVTPVPRSGCNPTLQWIKHDIGMTKRPSYR